MMMKRVSTVISSLFTAAILLFAMAPVASAEAADQTAFTNANTAQKAYYENTYSPSYESYKQTLLDLQTRIKNTNFETAEQAQRVLNFLNDLKTRHANFFGTRETVGKSRYDVPAARDAMYKAADTDKNYALAIQYCTTLKSLVEARVNFLNGLKNEIAAFQIIVTAPTTPTTPASDATIVFHANQIWSTSSFGFKIVITNKTNHDISDWMLKFNMTGSSINTIWINGGSMVFSKNGNQVAINPLNQWQAGYTLPANGTITLEGNANGDANNVTLSNALFNGTTVSISYIKG